MVILNLISVLLLLLDFATAEKYLLEDIGVSQRDNFNKDQGKCFINLGDFYKELRDYNKAMVGNSVLYLWNFSLIIKKQKKLQKNYVLITY